jgi:hypothetical protein
MMDLVPYYEGALLGEKQRFLRATRDRDWSRVRFHAEQMRRIEGMLDYLRKEAEQH